MTISTRTNIIHSEHAMHYFNSMRYIYMFTNLHVSILMINTIMVYQNIYKYQEEISLTLPYNNALILAISMPQQIETLLSPIYIYIDFSTT